MEDTILDVLKDRKYKNSEPRIVRREFRIPGTSIQVDAGDRVYYDEENNRIIIESGSGKHDTQGEDDE